MAKAHPGNGDTQPQLHRTHIHVDHSHDAAQKLAHLDDIMAIMVAAFDPAYGEAWNRSQTQSMLLMPSTHIWLARSADADETMPYQGFVIAAGHADEQEIMLVAVDPEKRNTGIGQALLSAVFDNSVKSGIAHLFLEMRHNNPASSFYGRLGFSAIGRRKNYYIGVDGTRYDAVTFRKTMA